MPRINSFKVIDTDYKFLVEQAQIYGFDNCQQFIKKIIKEKRLVYEDYKENYALK